MKLPALLNSILRASPFANERITPLLGGQINHTYQVGDNIILKVQKDLDVLLHQVPLMATLTQMGAKTPRILHHGVCEGKEYLFMEKLPGEKLSLHWLSFSTAQKQAFLSQLAEQLRIFHSVSFPDYSPQRPHTYQNWQTALEEYTDFTIFNDGDVKDDVKGIVATLKAYVQAHRHVLDETGEAVLVHNDLHFENILFAGDTLTGIIDFDFARQAPKDYELWHFIDFCREPAHYVEESQKTRWREQQLTEEISFLRDIYPALFAHDEVCTRLRVYMIEDILSQLCYGDRARGKRQYQTYFASDWLERALGNE